MKRALLLAVLVIKLLYVPIASAQEARTQWTPIEKPLTTLLNEGWRIISHSENFDVHYFYSFVLVKESKVAICMVEKPKPDNANSRCRALN